MKRPMGFAEVLTDLACIASMTMHILTLGYWMPSWFERVWMWSFEHRARRGKENET